LLLAVRPLVGWVRGKKRRHSPSTKIEKKRKGEPGNQSGNNVMTERETNKNMCFETYGL